MSGQVAPHITYPDGGELTVHRRAHVRCTASDSCPGFVKLIDCDGLLTPAEARALARCLERAADAVEYKEARERELDEARAKR